MLSAGKYAVRMTLPPTANPALRPRILETRVVLCDPRVGAEHVLVVGPAWAVRPSAQPRAVVVRFEHGQIERPISHEGRESCRVVVVRFRPVRHIPDAGVPRRYEQMRVLCFAPAEALRRQLHQLRAGLLPVDVPSRVGGKVIMAVYECKSPANP